jgi:excinuclease ABC subunit C
MLLDISALPDACGVYLFRSGHGTVIYVGKAINIRARVRSHFNDRTNPKEQRLCSETSSVDFMVTESELEALVLEDTLIKRHLPRFNVRLKDDKSYPYIVLTREEFPSVLQTRGLKPGQGEHFGPHGDPVAVRRSLRWLRKYFPVRSCRRDLSRTTRPCLEFHLGRCLAPCQGGVKKEDYTSAVEGLRRFLSGKRDELVPELEREMWRASSEESFERAAMMRDLVQGLKRMREGQKVILLKGGDLDLVHVNGGLKAASVLKIRSGRVVDLISFSLESEEPIDSGIEDFITRYYSVSGQVPSRILVDPTIPSNDIREELERFLSIKAGANVALRKVRGKDQRTLLAMAKRNTELYVFRKEREAMGEPVLVQLRERLGLTRVPTTIEGFDVSHLTGTGTVASMVQFRLGRPVRSGYRRFKVTLDRNDDTASMAEAVSRRLRGLLERKEPLPDLMVIDGGKGQLNAVMKVIGTLMLVERPDVVSIAKREEALFLPGKSEPLRLVRSDPVLRLLQQVRDESHRFTVSYQRKLRTIDLDLLKGIPGIGDARAKRIMMEFGSLDEVLELGPEVLSKRCSIPTGMAEKVIEAVRSIRVRYDPNKVR